MRSVTDATVRMKLFFIAVTKRLLRSVTTSVMFSHTCHEVGHEKSSRAASARSLTAVMMMKANGTTKTTTATTSVTASTQ